MRMAKLSKTPLEGDSTAEEWLTAIEEMRSCGDFDWADETLTSIYDQVRERGWITQGQKKALRNIAEARRFEGLEELK